MPLLEVEDLRVGFRLAGRTVPAVRGLCLALQPGETLALVGESGSGKSTATQAIVRLLPPTARVAAARLAFAGLDLLCLSERAMRGLRGRRIGIAFQDPAAALNPTMPVGRQVAEAAALHLHLPARAARREAEEWLERVGLGPQRAGDYPHQLSGGMRQRVLIAMALAGRPELLIADEPTASLDPTIGAGVLDLLADLRAASGMALLIVTHDVGVVARLADRVAVMVAGEVVEAGGAAEILRRPAHPYTRGLLAAAPWNSAAPGAAFRPIPGEPPDPLELPPGCVFAPRCRHAMRGCRLATPPAYEVGTDHTSRCWLHDPRAPGVGQRGDEAAGDRAFAEHPAATAYCPGAGGGASAGGRGIKATGSGPGGGGGGDAATGSDSGGDGGAPPARGGAWATRAGAGTGPDAAGDRALRAAPPLLQVLGLRHDFRGTGGRVTRAVDGVSLALHRGEVLGIAGESGCGKSTLVRLLAGLLVPCAGRVLLAGGDVHAARGDALRGLRRKMQVVFQNPYASLDPRMSVEAIVAEGLFDRPRPERQRHAAAALEAAGLPRALGARLPHELSGGQRQRVAIARALAVGPELLLADEPFAALDASAGAQVAALLQRLLRERQMACLLVDHDLAMLGRLCRRVAIMYRGALVEVGPAGPLLAAPLHPYARALRDAVPPPDPERERPRRVLRGDPDVGAPATGCPFSPSCPHARARCAQEAPSLAQVEPARFVACHYWQEEGAPVPQSEIGAARGAVGR